MRQARRHGPEERCGDRASTPASDDDEQTFHVIAPRLQFNTDWQSHEAIVISYVKWFFGPHSHNDGLNPRSPERIDDQMFTLNFNMWF